MTDQATVTKLPRPEPVPVQDHVQKLLHDSIQQIAEGWITELHTLQANATSLEKQVLEMLAQLKDNLNQFHRLGEGVAAEAKRGQDAVATLAKGIAQIGE